MERLLKRAGIGQLPLKDSFTAIKIHFGEPGNLAYIRPNYAARMAICFAVSEPSLSDGLQYVVFRTSLQCGRPFAERHGERLQSYIRPMPGDYCRRTKRDRLQRNTDRRRILPCSQDRYCHCRCGHNHQHEPF